MRASNTTKYILGAGMIEDREINLDGSTSAGIFLPLPYNLARDFAKKSEDDSVPHYTILYVGDVSPCDYPKLVTAVRAACLFIKPFLADLDAYAEFTNREGQIIAHMKPSIQAAVAMAKAHALIKQMVEALGIKVEHRYGKDNAFTPHATLAYLPKGFNYGGPKPTGSWKVTELEVWGHERARVSLGLARQVDQPLGLTRDPISLPYPAAVKEDQIPGGLADNSPDSDFDPEQLKAGMAVEREHTNDPKVAREIAKDHLKEDPKYYIKLAKMEKGREDNLTRSPLRLGAGR